MTQLTEIRQKNTSRIYNLPRITSAGLSAAPNSLAAMPHSSFLDLITRTGPSNQVRLHQSPRCPLYNSFGPHRIHHLIPGLCNVRCCVGRAAGAAHRSGAWQPQAAPGWTRPAAAPSFGSWPLGATLVPPKRLGRLGASGGAVATAAARAICCRANQRRLVLKWFVAFTARSRLISLGAAARLDLLETNDPPLSAAPCSAENRVLGCSQGAPAKGGGFPSTFVLGDSTKATTLLALGCAGTMQDSFKPVVNSPCFSHPADLSPGAGTKVGGGKHPAVSCSHCCPRDLTSSKGWRQQMQTAIPSVGCSKTSRYISLWCHTRALSYRYYTREMKDFFLLFLSSWNACTPLFLLLLAISHTHTQMLVVWN